MKGKARLIRTEKNGVYEVFVKNHFWQHWKRLYDDNGKLLQFKTFEEFGKITKIESFGEITIKYDNFQGM